MKTQGNSPSPRRVPTQVASPSPGAEPRFLYPVSVVAVILLSFAARVYHLGTAAIEFDEAFSIRTAASSLADILNAVANYEPHPPLYYSFLHFWYPVFGASEFSLRFPSLLTNVLTVALLIRVAASLGWRWPGVLAGLIFAFNPYQIWYAQEARMYAPVILFGLLAVYGGLQTARHRRRRDIVGYVAFMLLALYTHYYAIFLGVFVNLLVLTALWFDEGSAREARRSVVRRWLVAQLVVALLYLPWLVYAYRVSLDYSRAEIDLPGMLNIVKISLVQFSVGQSYPISIANSAALAFLAVLTVGLWGVGRSGAPWPAWRRYLLVVGYLLVPLALGGVASLSRSMFQTRYFLVSAPAFFLLLGLGSYQISRVSLPVGIAATLLILGIQVQSLNYYFFDPRYDKSEPADAIERVAGLVGPRDGVILDGWGQANQFWYYHDLRKSEPAPGWVLPLPGANAWGATLAQVDQIMAARSGVWLLTYSAPEVDGQRLIEGYLSHNYFPVLARHIITNDISYFVAPPATTPLVTPIGDTCNGSLQLDAVEDYDTSGPPGAILPVTVHWRATEPITHDYGISWRLLDSAGHTVLQRDTQPASGFSPTTTWPVSQEVLDRYGLLVPSDLPPGTYNLAVIAFDRSSGAECVFRHGQSALPGPAVPLLAIKVLDDSPASTLDQPAPSRVVAGSFGALTLDGYDLDPGPFRPGDSLAPRLYWHVNQSVAEDEVATVRLLDASGAVIDERHDKLGPADFPTSRWQSGREVADYLDVPIPPRTQSGTYQLTVSIAGAGSAGPVARLGPFRIVARPHTFQVPAISQPLAASFAGEVGLLGFASEPGPGGSLRPGDSLTVDLVWRDLQPISKNDKVFTHLVGPDGKTYGQEDAIPGAGQAPTNSWIPDEIIADHYQLTLQTSAPPGQYHLDVGLYDADSGARLPLDGQKADFLTVETLTVAR